MSLSVYTRCFGEYYLPLNSYYDSCLTRWNSYVVKPQMFHSAYFTVYLCRPYMTAVPILRFILFTPILQTVLFKHICHTVSCLQLHSKKTFGSYILLMPHVENYEVKKRFMMCHFKFIICPPLEMKSP